ncbi:MAG: metallophosphoesterase [Acidobacteria bacterium]|nr:metallophosphoesterase [Acidobacteriota bacterium]
MTFYKPHKAFALMASLTAMLVLLSLSVPSAAAKDQWDGVNKIVAVGDVHGDYDQFVAVLRSAGLIDEQNHWTGGDTHLVQTGDVPDRGPGTRKIIDLLMDLEQQAEKAKGYVHALIGNHESMNMFGDLRYVHPGEYASFADDKSAERREQEYERHRKELEGNPPAAGLPEFNDAYRERWFADHPLGYFEHREAFAPGGKYGKWILGHNAVIKINNTLFLHGGIGPKYVTESIKGLNRSIESELRDFSKLRGGVNIDPGGPLWYRGLAQYSEADEEQHLEAVLKAYGVKRIVIGHTVSPGTIWPRFRGRVVMIDVGMAAHYGGRVACLLIENGVPYTLHRGHKINFPSDSSADLLRYLKQAAALDPTPSPLATVIQQLEAVPAGR